MTSCTESFERKPERFNILLGATGSVACIKLEPLISALRERCPKIEIRLVLTENAQKFVNIGDIPSDIRAYTDKDEWSMWRKRGDPVLHIELRRWADLFLIAPLDANTLAKLANGLCDNLLTCVARAWDTKKPLFFAPAMNVLMYEHPLTAKQINQLLDLGYRQIPAIEKRLMCGDVGIGAMAEVSSIVDIIDSVLKQ